MNNTITCINCPVGCRMSVLLSESGEFLSVTGNTCARGSAYAKQECTQPMRMITVVLPVSGSTVPLSVKTSVPVPKAMIHQIVEFLANLHITAPVILGETIVHDVLHTGADIVATRTV